MKDHSADLMLPRTPAPRRRTAPAEGDSRRFSPLNAPQRAVVDAFCEQSRPWALRQAARTYRHLPEELREQAVDQAMRELRTGAPAGVDRRTLHAELAHELTEALRRVHVGWCLNQSSRLWRETAEQAPPAPPVEAREQLAGFIEDGLGGLERAVLQLEIGAGRDSRTVRAALRLGPRQYAHHREQGLSKLRDVITGSVGGQVCDHHLHSVVLAATGDRAAADALAGGPGRCRSCSREAHGLRRLLHERLALAPWPFVIKPATVIAAKLAALGAVGKGASGGPGALAGAGAGAGAASTGSVAIPTVLAVAALATGGGAAIGAGDGPSDRAKEPRTATTVTSTKPSAKDKAGEKRTAKATKERPAAAGKAIAKQKRKADRKRAVMQQPGGGGSGAGKGGITAPASTTAPATTTAPQTTTAAAPAATAPSGPTGTVIQKADDTVDQVQKTVGDATKPVLPPQVTGTVDQTVDAVQDTVTQVGGTVDGLLKPKP